MQQQWSFEGEDLESPQVYWGEELQLSQNCLHKSPLQDGQQEELGAPAVGRLVFCRDV